eukprot:TRINITY_DN32382_c0_g1_i1.p1 TRINITY_DN32382_c0_g1~~TRINITY_DN32382_c0_g1_i1.p1  ORF type:complete len:1119 (-),score=286.46 TRINITY_DN32382_c0_g1_i1:113-3469(-)
MAAQVQQLVDMGFAEADARRVLNQGFSLEQAIERLLSGSLGGPGDDLVPAPRFDTALGGSHLSAEESGGKTAEPDPEQLQLAIAPRGDQTATNAPRPMLPSEDADLNIALEMSMREKQDGLGLGGLSTGAFEGCMREDDLACGLRNIGNTCYVNSLLQTLLHVYEFRDMMLRYRTPRELGRGDIAAAPVSAEPEPEGAEEKKVSAQQLQRRKECSIRLASELRQLCAYGLFTLRSCIDPSRLLNEFVDEKGEKLPIGSQEDVGEFMLRLMERLEEGLKAGGFNKVNRAASEPPAAKEDSPAPPTAAAGDAAESCTPLQQLFFGQQVQIFSYCEEGGGSSASSASPGTPTDNGLPDAPGPPTTAAAESEATAVAAEAPAEAQGPTEAAAAPSPPPAAPAACSEEAAASAEVPSKGGLVVNEEKSDFLQIFLDVKYQDLYRAWEAANCTEVDYTTPSGATTKASTNIWIERLPRLLFFQLQRVVFDQETKAQVKLDEPFEFDSTIYVDRFLHENRVVATEASQRVRALRKRHSELTEALHRFTEFRGRPGVAADEVFLWAAECLEENSASSSSSSSKAVALEDAGPGGLCLSHDSDSRVLNEEELLASGASAAKLLRGMMEASRAKVTSLKGELEGLAREIDEAHRGLRRIPYELHAIWAHQGIAGSGHYWAYLRDWPNDRWLRFDDAAVSIVKWEDVRTAAVGGSSTSAYVFVYLQQDLASEQTKAVQAEIVKHAEALVPSPLLDEIRRDNISVQGEHRTKEERLAEQELRQHAEAIFQHYAGLIHKWEPKKQTQDTVGSPLDPTQRKYLHDSALLCFELFLYRVYGDEKVYTHFLALSIEDQRQIRHWKEEDEGMILYFVGVALRNQKCWAKMLKDLVPGEGKLADMLPSDNRARQCELVPLELNRLLAEYNVVLTQAHIIDDALETLKADNGTLLETIGALAYVWANVEAHDKFRLNEVLLVMSTLIYHIISVLERHRKTLGEPVFQSFHPACDYFMLLLFAVEWPKSWKAPLIERVQKLYPSIKSPSSGAAAAQAAEEQRRQKDKIKQHQVTARQAQRTQEIESQRPEPGQLFFDRHRTLYSWVMTKDEAIAREYVFSRAPPELREQLVDGAATVT